MKDHTISTKQLEKLAEAIFVTEFKYSDREYTNQNAMTACRVKAWLKLTDFKQQSLAETLDADKGYLSQFLTNNTHLLTKHYPAEKLAAIMGVEESWLTAPYREGTRRTNAFSKRYFRRNRIGRIGHFWIE